MTVADLYVRKSSLDDGASVGQQEAEGRVDVAEQGWSVGRVFADPDRSASSYAKRPRPGYAELIEHIKSGACRLLVLWESSRGSRTLTEWSTLLDLCLARDVRIRVTSDERTYDLDVGNDWRVLASAGVDSHYESVKISKRTRRGKTARATNGQPMGITPYGYLREYALLDGRSRPVAQVPNPDTAPVVVEAFRRVAEGDPLSAVAADFTASGIPSPKGGPWGPTTIRAIVTNRAYVGDSVLNGEVMKADAWPALIDRPTFNKADRTVRNKARRTQRGTELRWVLSGVARCGVCGGRLITHYGGSAGTGRVRRYCCGDNKCTIIAAEPLDKLVEATVKVRLGRRDALDLFTRPADDATVDKAKAEVDRLRGELDDWRAAAARGEVTRASFASIEPGLLVNIAAADKRYNALSLPPALADLAGVDVPAKWDSWPVRKRRDIIAAVVDLVVGPAVRGHNWFNPGRLGGSRWVGDETTWHEHGIV